MKQARTPGQCVSAVPKVLNTTTKNWQESCHGLLPSQPSHSAARIRGYVGGEWVPLQLVGVGEAPGARRALARLLAASSVAQAGGWRVGWPPQQQRQEQQPQQGQAGVGAPWAALAAFVTLLAPQPGGGWEEKLQVGRQGKPHLCEGKQELHGTVACSAATADVFLPLCDGSNPGTPSPAD